MRRSGRPSTASHHSRRTTCFRHSDDMMGLPSHRDRAVARIPALVVALAASFVACDRDPVGANVDPRLAIAADSVTVNMFTSAWVFAAVSNTVDAPQYVSRDQRVATVNALGAVTGMRSEERRVGKE